MEKRDIVSYNYDELQDEIKSIGEKPFRAKQIYAWLHEKLAEEFDEMTNLSKALREKLDQAYEIRKVKVVAHQISKVDPTEKFLFELEDGNRIESVLMKYNYGNSVCISSQVGCRMGCRFCASTLDGLERNLTTSEMLRQIYQIQKMTWVEYQPEKYYRLHLWNCTKYSQTGRGRTSDYSCIVTAWFQSGKA